MHQILRHVLRATTGIWGAVGAIGAALPHVAVAQEDLGALSPASVAPDFVALGYGTLPAYLGSDEYFTGIVPVARLSRGNRFVALNGNFVTANVLEHPNIRVGPVARLRFGRNKRLFDDPVVSTLPEIDPTLELGAFANWTEISATDPRNRWQVGGEVSTDVLGRHGGTVGSIYARQFFGLGRFAVGGVAVAASYGSAGYMDTFFGVAPGAALPAFEAEAGWRDIRLQAGAVQPLSENWAIGAGFQYARLLGDAAESPIVSDRGTPDQWIVGVGLTYILGFN